VEQPSNSQRNRAAHLKKHQFKPGQSGNQAGRPGKGFDLNCLITDLLQGEELRGQRMPKNKSVGQVIAENLVVGAVDIQSKHHVFCLKEVVTRFAPVIQQSEIEIVKTDEESGERRPFTSDELRQIVGIYSEAANARPDETSSPTPEIS
jgi:hypothetical protein